jgi:hypothetical protein
LLRREWALAGTDSISIIRGSGVAGQIVTATLEGDSLVGWTDGYTDAYDPAQPNPPPSRFVARRVECRYEPVPPVTFLPREFPLELTEVASG